MHTPSLLKVSTEEWEGSAIRSRVRRAGTSTPIWYNMTRYDVLLKFV